MLLFLTNPSLDRSEGFLYACSWALIAGSLFLCRCSPWPAFTLEARSMVGSNDPEEGTTQLSPELWIDFGTTDILVPVFE